MTIIMTALLFIITSVVFAVLGFYFKLRVSGCAKHRSDHLKAFGCFVTCIDFLILSWAVPAGATVWVVSTLVVSLFVSMCVVFTHYDNRRATVYVPPGMHGGRSGFATGQILLVVLLITSVLYLAVRYMAPKAETGRLAGISTNTPVTEASFGSSKMQIITLTDGRQLVVVEDKHGAKAVHELVPRK